MKWKQPTNPFERVAEVCAALTLGGAVAFGVHHTAPLAGLALAGAVSLCAAAAVFAGLALLGRVDVASDPEGLSFEPQDFACEAAESDGIEDELLLDDPVAPLAPQSRVVELFEPQQPEALPEPGEMVTRIADYLGSGRSVAPSEPVRHDASAALHAALADIRRSLR